MDLFVATCQGIGLALAAGAFGGASARRGPVGLLLLAIAVIGGAVMFGASLATEDHPAWPGWPIGALLAAFAFVVVREVAEGAAARPDAGPWTGALLAGAALVLAGLSLLPASPISLVALATLAWLWLARRGRAARKYEGLRSLR
ncbi:MAG: hypothetical protein ACJ75R_02010 [Solirubrobacterales bacterium]